MQPWPLFGWDGMVLNIDPQIHENTRWNEIAGMNSGCVRCVLSTVGPGCLERAGRLGLLWRAGLISAAWSWWIFSGATWPILSKMSEYLNQLCFFFSFITFILPTCVRLPVPSSFIDFPPLRIGSNQPTKDFEWMTEAVGVVDLRWLVLMPFWDPKRIPPENWTPQGPSFFLGELYTCIYNIYIYICIQWYIRINIYIYIIK